MSEHTQCPAGHECANVVRLNGELRVVQESSRRDVEHLNGFCQDMRAAIAAMPDRVTAAIRDERAASNKEFARGSEHFKTLYDRTTTLEKIATSIEAYIRSDEFKTIKALPERLTGMDKRITLLTYAVIIFGLGEIGKVIAWLAPVIGRMVP